MVSSDGRHNFISLCDLSASASFTSALRAIMDGQRKDGDVGPDALAVLSCIVRHADLESRPELAGLALRLWKMSREEGRAMVRKALVQIEGEGMGDRNAAVLLKKLLDT